MASTKLSQPTETETKMNEIKIQKRQTKYSGIVEDIYVNGKLHVSAVGKKMQSVIISRIKNQISGKITICFC